MRPAKNRTSLTLPVLRRFGIAFVWWLVAGLGSCAQPFSPGDVLTLQCQANNSYVTVQAAPGLHLAANRSRPGALQQFILQNGGDSSFALQARVNGRYVCAEDSGAQPLVANRTAIGP